jgi:hypothetical protein
VRRAHALGELARGTHPTLDLDIGPTEDGVVPAPRRQVVLHVHLTDAALGDAPGPQLARVDNTRSFVDADQVRTWCATPGTTVTVKRVLDLAEHLSATGYETPDRLAEQAAHVDETCVFPWCTAPPAAATATTSYRTQSAGRPARATSPGSAAAITGSRPTPPGNTPSSNAAATCGPAPTASASTATAPAPPTSAGPTRSERAATSPTADTCYSSPTPDHHAPHPADGGGSGMRIPLSESPDVCTCLRLRTDTAFRTWR